MTADSLDRALRRPSTDPTAHLAAALARAEAEGLVDVAYATADTPIGPLLVAATDAGLVRLAFDGEDDADVGVGQISQVAKGHRPPLLVGQAAHGVPELAVDTRGSRRPLLGKVGHGDRPARRGTVVVDDLVVGDGEEPTPQVPGIPEVGIGAQGRDHRLLEAVGAMVWPRLPQAEAVEVGAVGVEEHLEGRQVHWWVNAGHVPPREIRRRR